MRYSIKEIADTVGVSKTAVRKKIEKLGLQTELLKNGNKITVDENVAKQIITAFDRPTENETQTEFANQNDNEFSKVIEILQAELESKNKQLASKDRQIEDLTRALENTTASLQAEQALHAGTMQKQLSSGEEQEQAEDQEKTKTDKKRHWWQFHK
mgnify:FL=1|jgi:predicted DNA-binding protein YlxM (UPF0122 family)|uniref:Helix-turn-helix type 11 domain-containing protein n=1 Tax=uncultured prokaryote TaxID=198431 RepID=A0A0H5QE29_9ZZZZ|nr:hypothetical protein [uncultured prokaryote]